MIKYIYSVQSEWLKTKRSAAAWLSFIGGLFIPLIYMVYFFKTHRSINSYSIKPWETHFGVLWNFMISFILPMGVILASSLITQLEYKNNTWKQLHTTTQSLTTVFLAKLSVILLLTLQFFVFFNIGLLLSGIIPSLVFEKYLPAEQFPFLFYLKGNTKFFIACLPIIAIQYLISLQYKNFLIPVGAGLMGLIGTMIALKWEYIYLSPFSYNALISWKRKMPFGSNVYLVAIALFILITIVSYTLYINKKEKG